MNLKTPDYKAQAENLRATLLSYIDCVKEVQFENGDLRKENEDLKQKVELYKAIIFERDKKIFNQKVTIENLFKERDEAKQDVHNYYEALVDEENHTLQLQKENEVLKDQLKKINANTTSLLAKIHELETILNIYEGRKHD